MASAVVKVFLIFTCHLSLQHVQSPGCWRKLSWYNCCDHYSAVTLVKYCILVISPVYFLWEWSLSERAKMHHFQSKSQKIFWGGGTAPSPHLTPSWPSATRLGPPSSKNLAQPPAYTVSGKKEATRFFLHNFNKCRHSFAIFGMNHPEDSFC